LQTQGLACSEGDLQTLITVGEKLARDGALTADGYFPDASGSNCGSWLAGDGDLTADESFLIHLDQTVGAGLTAMAACQPMSIFLMHPD